MRRISIAGLAFLLMGLLSANSFAHFLFIRIGAQAEAGRAAEVFFSEYATAGDPRFVPRVAHTELWQQTRPGEFQPLDVKSLDDRLRAHLPASGTVSVSGRCIWGVMTREVPFLLEYYPKAISGDPSTLDTLKPNSQLPLEIVARIGTGENGITLSLLQDGKPVPGAKFTTVDDDLNNEELTANDAGEVTWKPGSPGYYCVYARVTLPDDGEHEGTSYTEVRRFATIAFPWPLVRSEPDAEAFALFKHALADRATWDKFPGFTADISGSVDGRAFDGSAKVDADGTVTLDVGEEPVGDWATEQLGSIVMHRQSSSSDDNPALQFADNDTEHPLGRLLTFLGGHFASSYRVKDDRITVVNRAFGKENMTITVLEESKNAESKSLPSSYVVQYWDAATGNLARTQTIHNTWQRVGAFDLPASLTVTESSSTGHTVRSFTLKEHKLAESP